MRNFTVVPRKYFSVGKEERKTLINFANLYVKVFWGEMLSEKELEFFCITEKKMIEKKITQHMAPWIFNTVEKDTDTNSFHVEMQIENYKKGQKFKNRSEEVDYLCDKLIEKKILPSEKRKLESLFLEDFFESKNFEDSNVWLFSM